MDSGQVTEAFLFVVNNIGAWNVILATVGSVLWFIAGFYIAWSYRGYEVDFLNEQISLIHIANNRQYNKTREELKHINKKNTEKILEITSLYNSERAKNIKISNDLKSSLEIMKKCSARKSDYLP